MAAGKWIFAQPSGAATVPPGAGAVTVVGASTIEAALSANNDTQYVYQTSSTTAQAVRFTLTYVPGGGRRIDYVQPYFRHTFDRLGGWWYPARITGYRTTDGTPHTLNLTTAPSTAPGLTINFFQSVDGPVSTRAADGTLWADCNRFDVEWAINVVFNTPGSSASAQTTLYGVGGWPKLSVAWMRFGYTFLPNVNSGLISPAAGTITTPQPSISWYPPNEPQSSYRAMLIPSGVTDAAGVASGAVGFDPTTASTITYDSDKVTSASTVIPSYAVGSLANGSYYTYIRVWTATAQGELVGPWVWGSLFTVATDNVDPATVSLSNHTATNTVQVVIGAGTHTGGYQIPQLYQVQVFDPETGWVVAPILNGTVAGNTTSTFFDGRQRPGSTVQYRARGRYLRGDGATAVSPWVTASLVVADPHQWWLRHPTDRLLNRSLSDTATLLMKDWQPSRARPQVAAWGIGAKYATITHDVVKSTTAAVTVWAMNATALADLKTLIEGDEDIVLVTPWAEMFRVQLGGQISETPMRVAPRQGETGPLGLVRQVAFTLIEVSPV